MYITFRKFVAIPAATLFCLLASPSSVLANPIPGLFNTGVDDFGSLLPNGSVDLHYDLVGPPPSASCPLCAGPAVARATDAAWIAPPSGSKWIGPDDPTNGAPAGTIFVYTLSFDLTGLDPTTAVVSGLWSSDNGGLISLNGVDTTFDTGSQSDQPFRSLHNFSLTGGFISGVNELTFTVLNGGGPTSLLVANVSGTADVAPIPEPSTGLLMGFGLLGLAIQRRRFMMER